MQAAATATAEGSIPNSSFIASTNSITSLIDISFNEEINDSFVNFAMILILSLKSIIHFLFHYIVLKKERVVVMEQ
nr:hypothetical protein [Mycoplasmopsis bovis]